MCIGDIGDRIPYGFLFKNDLNEFIYSCSRCDEEFRVGNDLEQHSIGHDIKEENEMGTHPDLAVEAKLPLPPSESVALLPAPIASTSSRRPSRHTPVRRKSRASKSSNLPPSTSPTSTSIEIETRTPDTETNDEMFDVEKLEVDIEKQEQNEPASFVDDDDFSPFADDSSFDDDFYKPTSVKQANKQKEAAAVAAVAAAKATSSSKKSKTPKKMPKEKVTKKKLDYHCDICARICTSLSHIRQHMNAAHVIKKKNPPKKRRPPTPTQCTLCGRHVRNVKMHLNTFHSNERPFECNYCDVKFKKKVHRDTHERRHTGEKPYICHLCGLGYCAKSVLNAHMNRSHLHKKPHKCDQCGRAYLQSFELRDHINLHHLNQKMYQCETCDRRFGTRKHLLQHQLSHGEKRFQCKFCDQKFATSSGRRGHEVRLHGSI